MKIAIVLGRGTEGCGVTQCAVQMQGVTGAKIFSASDKKWPRGAGITFERTEFSMAKDWEKYADEINGFDLCIVYSVPSKGHPEDCQANFLKFLKKVAIRKVFINVDHKAASIARNANLKEVCESVDLLMTHSMHNDFCKFLKKENVSTPVSKMELGFDYDGHRTKYWKPIVEQAGNKTLWIGRSAMWKAPDLMIDFHQDELMGQGFITVLEGLEASIQYPFVLYRDHKNEVKIDRRKVVNYFRAEKQHGETAKFSESLHGLETVGNGAYLYPQYTNAACMERMSLSGFGSDLYHLKAETYGNNIENCHAEIVASGAVPIFHKHFCDNVIHKVQGKPVSECIDTGTIGLDYSNFVQCRDTMMKLRDDPGMRNEWREMAVEFWKQHSDAKDVIADILAQSVGVLNRKQVQTTNFGDII